ncbi:hypothetical protein E2C01_027241 [Portunus trituberculatus]|uniref:Uncharacterized protein n=1 Tax=Portunus trituberculatus TaxID=210409 RepID=A0A5B7EN78_PORTR|nr:hypothetical protein [Portunus trituberculatus]
METEETMAPSSPVGSYTLLQVLKVLSNSMKHVPADRAEDLHHQLVIPLSSFSVGTELISSMMDTVTLLTYTLHGDDIETSQLSSSDTRGFPLVLWLTWLHSSWKETRKHLLVFEAAVYL